MKQVRLTNSDLVVLVDNEDFERVQKFRWRLLSHDNYAGTYGYSKKNGKNELVLMHRLLMQPDNMVDHIDRNGLNNQKSNLRLCNMSQNAANRTLSPLNKSGYKGVFKLDEKLYPKNPWKAKIGVNSKRKSLGNFSTALDAAKAYDKAAVENFGDFALTNKKMNLY